MCETQFLTSLFSITWIFLFHGNEVTASVSDALNHGNVDTYVWHHREPRVAALSNKPLTCERSNIYRCEEPPDTVPPDATKTCNYRNVRYHEQVFRWVAGRGCLLYTPDFLYVAGSNIMNLNAGCYYGNLFAPCLEIAKEDGSCGCYPFDPGLEEVAATVRAALIPAAQGRWERCFYAASDCCSHYMQEEPNTKNNQCEATFDGWTCWQQVEGGTLASEVCSEFAYSNTGPSCHHYSTKNCYNNGTWELQTDYSTCSITQRLLTRYRYYIVVLAFSIASCLPAVFIFFFYKRLRITRVILHRNLLISIIIRNLFVIISRSEIYIDELTSTGVTVMSENGVACQLLAFAERFAGNVVFVCMLVEGVYLHRTIVTVFRKKLKIRLLYGVGFVIALVPAIAWAVVMAVYNDHSCWLVYTMANIQWILDAPRIAILVVNTGLFMDVLRVLLTKIRNSENKNQLNTAKATLFLMPLFGSQFLLTAFRPNTSICTLEEFYYYVAYTVEGLQGFIVAMLFCYINTEVHILIKATYKKTENAVVSRIRRDSVFPNASIGTNNDRRNTCSTGIPSSENEDGKDQYATITPKLHVAEIISIQASERLAEILEPVYETIPNGITNASYDSLERTDNDSGIIPNRNSKEDDYYGFTNASSISVDCPDWIRCISSPSSSVYNNSLNDYETKYLEKKFPNHKKPSREMKRDQINTDGFEIDNKKSINEDIKHDQTINKNNNSMNDDYEECDQSYIDDIIQHMETTENALTLDPNYLSPNRKEDDKIIFINE